MNVRGIRGMYLNTERRLMDSKEGEGNCNGKKHIKKKKSVNFNRKIVFSSFHNLKKIHKKKSS